MSASDTKTFVLGDERDRHHVASLVARAPEGWTVTFKPPSRTLAQNARFHAMISDIEAAGFALGDRRLTFREIKVAFMSGWMISEGFGSDIDCGLREEPVQFVRSTTTFSAREMASLIDYTSYECAERGIPLKGERS